MCVGVFQLTYMYVCISCHVRLTVSVSPHTAATACKLPGPGDEKHKRNLSELFKPPHDILFNGTFQEVFVC